MIEKNNKINDEKGNKDIRHPSRQINFLSAMYEVTLSLTRQHPLSLYLNLREREECEMEKQSS